MTLLVENSSLIPVQDHKNVLCKFLIFFFSCSVVICICLYSCALGSSQSLQVSNINELLHTIRYIVWEGKSEPEA